MAQKNTNLQAAKNAKNDNFYTRMEDIIEELQHYTHHFKDKIVYCNCDADWSNFWKYFHDNFHDLGLKKLIATHYEEKGLSYKLEYDGCEVKKEDLQGNGDFRSEECVELLKEADIVSTNMPFSLFRPFMAQLIEYNKKFVVIASMNAITYKEFFPLLKDNKVWLGYNSVKEFIKPDGSTQKFGNICWYTNLDIDKRHKELVLTKKYNPKDYPKYDNYDAIECNKVANIPADYFPCWYFCDKADVCEYAQKRGVGDSIACCDADETANKCNGVIGVPITFLEDYLPEQFGIVGLTSGRDEFECRPIKRYENARQHNPDGSITNGSKANTRATLPTKDDGSTYYTADNSDEKLKIVYARVLIQRKCNGMIGVPITFLDKYNPDEFEIVGCSSELAKAVEIDGKTKDNPQRFYVDGKRLYDRIVIKKKQK